MKLSITALSLSLLTNTSPWTCQGFQQIVPTTTTSARRYRASSSSLSYSRDRYSNNHDADMMELLVGGRKYEMVPLPDSMMDTTIFVGNLCEFCKDEDLSNLFQVVSTLHSVPACVVRKPNYASLGYGFVTFLTIQEKEAAIMRFHGSTFKGRSIKVEEIRDHPKMGRVKVPEQMVSYVVGKAKRAPGGNSNGNNNNSNNNNNVSSLRSVSRLDQQKKKQPQLTAKQQERNRKMKEQKKLQRQLKFPLTIPQQDELLRASRRGYLTVEGKGLSRDRTYHSLACAHRQYCDERERPQIVLCKAVSSSSSAVFHNKQQQQQPSSSSSSPNMLDCLIVDLSPLRLTSAVGDELVDDFLTTWKTQILAAAAKSKMELKTEYREDNCHSLSIDDDIDNDDCTTIQSMDQGIEDCMIEASLSEANGCHFTVTFTDEDSWKTEPISRLPVVSMGIFEGERSHAKAMAKELAELWDLPMEPLDFVEGEVEVRIRNNNPMGQGGLSREGGGGKKSRNNNSSGGDRRQRKDENRRNRRNDQQYLNRKCFED